MVIGTKPTLSWIPNKLLPGSLGVQLVFRHQHRFLRSNGARGVAHSGSDDCSAQSLRGQGLLLGEGDQPLAAAVIKILVL